ncbi:hypothetical protein ACERK3_15340 [Phycisphaerales bacterium AB-hyl4]|uniref:Glycosyltransferase n=1 Tax=Natronomicrosphaera hydrolytica TaxID=3242702 RepID=A0ABV4U8Q2_9BACT
MEVSGFTFIRNAVKYDYPAVEAIRSVLPLVDEFVINVGLLEGEPDDGTLELVRSIGDPKIRIIESRWNPNLATGGYVYAQQTNVALFNCQGKWAVYVQCDEVVHDEDYDILRDAMRQYADRKDVDALMLWQRQFLGDYQTIFNVWPWTMRRKCWIVKPHHFVLSRGDAANFTVHPKFKERGRKIRAVQTAARQFHYCEVKTLKALAAKRDNRQRFWAKGEDEVTEVVENYYYQRFPKAFLGRYEGTHPQVMAQRMAEHPIKLDPDSHQWRQQLTWKERRQLIKGWLVEHTTDRFTGRGDHVLVETHRL